MAEKNAMRLFLGGGIDMHFIGPKVSLTFQAER